MTDTVGFIDKLPHHLIDAFRSTLEEAKHADLIIHVVDCSNPEQAGFVIRRRKRSFRARYAGRPHN